MASFQANIGRKRPAKRENKNYRSIPFLPNTSLKIPKKFKKLKNSVMASFQANIGRKRPGKRENKNYRFVLFLPGA